MAVSRFTDNGGVRLHFVDSGGDDRGAPIVFVPGMTCLAEDYAEVLPVFGRRTVVAEIRGHGRSAAPAGGYDGATLSSDVGAIVDAVTSGPVHLVTFSRGTAYAIGWALRNPSRVRSLAIGDYIPEERLLPPGAPRRLLDGRWRGTAVRERVDYEAAMKTFRSARARSFWNELAGLHLPLLVVRSGERVLVTDEQWLRYRQEFPQATLVEFEDSPHDIFRQDRRRFPQLVREHADRADDR